MIAAARGGGLAGRPLLLLGETFMPSSSSHTAYGGWLMITAAFVAVIVAAGYAFSVGNGIALTLGTYLVLGSSAALLVLSMLLAATGMGRGLRGLVLALTLIDILATALAAYFLLATWLIVLMAVALVGWLVHLFLDSPLHA